MGITPSTKSLPQMPTASPTVSADPAWPPSEFQSADISQLAYALAAAQLEFPVIPKDAENPHFRSKHATLDGAIEGVKKILPKHGLSYAQFPISEGDYFGVRTIIMHTSGQWIAANAMIKPIKLGDPQAAGAIVTYFRRYGLLSALGLATGEDDDGHGATTNQGFKAAPPPPGLSPQITSQEVPNKTLPQPPVVQPAKQQPTISNLTADFVSQPNKEMWQPKFKRPTGDKAREPINDGQKGAWFYIIKETGWTDNEAHELINSRWGYKSKSEMTRGDFWDFDVMLHTKPRQELLKQLHEFDSGPQADVPPPGDDLPIPF